MLLNKNEMYYDLTRTLLDTLQEEGVHLYRNAGTGYIPLSYSEISNFIIGPIPEGWNEPREDESGRRDIFGRKYGESL